MSALDNTIAMLEHDLRIAKLGRMIDVARIERSLERLRRERAEEFAQWLDTIPKATWTTPNLEPERPGWALTPQGIDETFSECEERANRCSPTK